MRKVPMRLEHLMPLIREELSQGKPVWFTPHGISMRPMLEDGRDRVMLVPPPQVLKKYDLALYQRENGQYVLHRVVKVGQTYTFVGDNQFVYEPNIRPDQVIAVVSEFVRKGRHYDVRHGGYRLYCRVWIGTLSARHFAHKVRRKLQIMLKISKKDKEDI